MTSRITGDTTGSRARLTTGSRPSLPPSGPDLSRTGPDFILCVAVGLLVSLGLVMVYSSSSVYAARIFGDSERFIKLQLMNALLGVVALLLVSQIPSRVFSKRAGWILTGAVALCVVVLIPGIGVLRGGARRWLEFRGVGFQPSEVAKLAVVIVVAGILARRELRSTDNRPSLLIPILVAQVPVALLLAEPDLGTALVVELIVASLVFVAGVRVRTLLVLGLAALPVFYHLVVGTPFRLRRLLSYIDPWAYRSTLGYQVTEALISIGSGGVTGLGLGEGTHRLFYVPEAHTDFIFAIVGQELGLIGCLVTLIAFGLVLWRAIHIAVAAPTPFQSYLAVGVAALVGVPAVFNVCVVTGLLPTKGLPLPFVSYGGSNLLVTLAAIGLLLRIDADIRRPRQLGGNMMRRAEI